MKITTGWPYLVVIMGGVKAISSSSPSCLALSLVTWDCLTARGEGGCVLVDGFILGFE